MIKCSTENCSAEAETLKEDEFEASRQNYILYPQCLVHSLSDENLNWLNRRLREASEAYDSVPTKYKKSEQVKCILCDKKVHARGYCSKHYGIFFRRKVV